MTTAMRRVRVHVLGPALAVGLAVLLIASGVSARAFRDSGSVQEFTPQEVLQILIRGGDDGPVVIDARPRNKFAEGHLPGALNVDSKETWGRLGELRRYQHRGIIYYDKKGLASRMATRGLLKEGFRRVGVMRGHLVEWERLGYPVEIGGGGGE